MKTKEKSDTMEVKASANFRHRRLISIAGLTTRQYRQLQSGLKTIIPVETFEKEPSLYERIS